MKLTLALATTLSLLPIVQCRLHGPQEHTNETNNLDIRSILGEEAAGSECINIKDETQCNTSSDTSDLACVWCTCAAVPSECVNVEQSKKLPTGVFECASPPSDTEKEEDLDAPFMKRTSPALNDAPGDKRYDGSFLNYELTDNEVAGELCDPKSKSVAGYVDITGSQYDTKGEDKHLFYWFFEKRPSGTEEVTETDGEIPLILWLTGGPGCSSTLALLTENGPCSVSSDGKSTEINPHSWTEAAHVLWLDQPAGVGFSYGKANDYNEEMISEDAYYFLQGFFKSHPEYASSPLYVVGESYGGHYAPAIAHKAFTKNKKLEDKTLKDDTLLKINLAGLAVGNGLTDPVEQYKWYPEMAYKNSHGIKTISEQTYNTMTSTVPTCTKLIAACNKGTTFLNSFACQSAFLMCNAGLTSPYQLTGLNPYDIRKKCGSHPLCYDFSNVETWLNTAETKKALNVKEGARWQTCNMGINLKFHTDWMKDFSPFVADLINAGIPALIYAGDVDFICNYLGNQAWTLGLEWDHKDDFNKAEVKEWGKNPDGKAAGLARTSNGFTFLQVYDAGHMVPSDQPEVALSMIQNFVKCGAF
jgi:cathepsin A (carboxypeptidase C)